jgi:hypothetical protein
MWVWEVRLKEVLYGVLRRTDMHISYEILYPANLKYLTGNRKELFAVKC